MAIQFDPIAKDESLNTTEATPRNIADVLAEELRGIASVLTPAQLAGLADVMISSPSDGQTLKYDAVSQKWVNANDAGGHTIENPSGTDMTQRANLQFVDAHLTDDSVNDRTEVENIKDINSADYANATEDGFYNVTDESDEELTAADIPYDANDSIKEKIDEVNGRFEWTKVSDSTPTTLTQGQVTNVTLNTTPNLSGYNEMLVMLREKNSANEVVLLGSTLSIVGTSNYVRASTSYEAANGYYTRAIVLLESDKTTLKSTAVLQDGGNHSGSKYYIEVYAR